jgi:hypothetical protein
MTPRSTFRRSCRISKRMAFTTAGTRGVRRCLNTSMRRVGWFVILIQHVALNGGDGACRLCRRCARLVVAWPVSLAMMFAVSTAACALGHSASVRDLVNVSTPLTDNEVTRVLRAARAAIARKSGRLISAADEAAGRPGTDFAIGSNGRLQFVRSSGAIQGGIVGADGMSTTWRRELVTITHLTGIQARGCDGTARTGQLVVEYRNDGGGWVAMARTGVYPASPTPLDDFLAGALPVKSNQLQMIGARRTRMFVAPWTPPVTAEASPNSYGPEYRSDDGGRTWTKSPPASTTRLTQSLWIDTASLLPVRWAVMFAADPEHGIPAKLHTVLSVAYDERIDLRPPPGITPPDCVP